MSCIITPYNLLTGIKQPGGNWTLEQSPQSAPMIVSINGAANTNISVGSPIPGPSDLTLGFNGTAAGTYVLRYTVGTAPCTDSSLVTVNVVPSAKAGSNQTLTFCNSDTSTYNLFQFLRNFNGLGGLLPGQTEVPVDTTGTWSGSGTSSVAYNPNTPIPTDDTFRPNLVVFTDTTTQTFIFDYTVTVPNTAAGCTNCTDTARITINVVLAANAGTDAQVTVCNAL